jgi:hypothetical protein
VSPLAISFIVLGCISAGIVVGMVLGHGRVAHHLDSDTRDILKMSLGTIATLTALVLGLLVAASKGTYDTQAAAVREIAADVLMIDRILSFYGPEAKAARGALRDLAVEMSGRIYSIEDSSGFVRVNMEEVYNKVVGLSPLNDAQRGLKERAIGVMPELGRTRLRMVTRGSGSVPTPFLLVLGFWLVILFLGYGVLAPRNATASVAVAVCALSVAGALFLILELDHPLGGIMRIPLDPLTDVIPLLDK